MEKLDKSLKSCLFLWVITVHGVGYALAHQEKLKLHFSPYFEKKKIWCVFTVLESRGSLGQQKHGSDFPL